MKQKLILLLSLVSMAWSSAVYAAERVAPTLPTAQTPESGKSYWIYNVGTGLFLGNSASSDSNPGISIDGNEFFIESANDGYSIRRGSAAGFYLVEYSSSSLRYTSGGYGACQVWTITNTSGNYKIQRSSKSSYYQADQYIGYPENGGKFIYPNVTADNIEWRFFNPTEAAHYAAELKLYQALESTTGTALEGLDWFLGQYETLYSNRAIATTGDLTNAATIINRGVATYNGYEFPEWNDYVIVFYTSEGNWGQSRDYTWALSSNSSFERRIYNSGTSSLTATLSVDQDSRFIYELGSVAEKNYYQVFVDGVETRFITSADLRGDRRFFEVLTPGKHTITWQFTSNYTNSYYYEASVRNIGCIAAPLISVSLLEPGSLGTEVLYNTDHIKNVHNLKVAGKMNDDDWAKIKMMTTLIDLDLSEAEFTTVPYQQFQQQKFLRKVILPEGVETIGDNAFDESNLEETNFPSTLTQIGYRSYRSTHLKEAILSDNLASLGEAAFQYNYRLTKVDLGKVLTTIPQYCFYECPMLKDLIMPNTVTTIQKNAFYNNTNLVISTLSSNLTSIGETAFYGCKAIVSMTIPESVRSIGLAAFSSCQGLKSVEVPMANWKFSESVFSDCTSLETIKLNSATVAECWGNSSNWPPTSVAILSNVTLQVPSYLVNSYKLDSYWYNAKAIEGFDPNTFDFYEIHKNLTMNGRERFGTNPSAKVYGGIYLKMNGDEAQNFNDFQIDYNSQLWCTGDNIKATGDLSVVYNTSEKRWYFISLPFDMKVANIDAGGAQYAIRYYDGANRATVGATGSWKNYEADDVIPAGTGFIYQTNKDAWTKFYADPDGENKQQIFSTGEFSKPLELHASATAANRGWNLVGNPYQCYYNNHALNFTAPITVWDVQNRTYTAYSLTDDDYAIRPNEAFFVQCPGDEVLNITFPTQGKQMTDVIESQNAGKMRRVQAVEQRQLIDLEVRNGEVADKTRVVMNEEASLGYDMDCDASKFMSAEAPQIYTIGDDGTAYAINERPSGEGEVQLGFYAEKQGAFTISMPRCQAQKVYLVDTFENLTVDLTEQDYGFTAAAGKQEARFRLVIDAGETTAIKDVKSESVEESEDGSIYNLNGQRVGDDYKGIAIKDGKKVYIK